ncbi:hypothetical protein VKS41_005448 [Umbelopsis sp. WA50703]
MNIDLDWCIVCDSRTDRGLYCSNKCSSQDKQTNQQSSATNVTESDVSAQDEALPHHKEDSLSAFYANHAPSPPPIAKSPTPSEILSSSYTIYSRSRRSSVLAIPSPSPSGKGTYFVRD